MMFPPGEETVPEKAEGTPSPDPSQEKGSSEISDRESKLESRLTDMGRVNQALLKEVAELKGRVDERSATEAKATAQAEAVEKTAKAEDLMKKMFSSDNAADASQALTELLQMHGEAVAGQVRQDVEAEYAPRLRKTEGDSLKSTVERTLRAKGAPTELANEDSSFFKFLQEQVNSNRVLATTLASGDYDSAVDYVFNRYKDKFGDPGKTQLDRTEARREASALESGPSAGQLPVDIQKILDDESISDMEDIYKALEAEGVFSKMEGNL